MNAVMVMVHTEVCKKCGEGYITFEDNEATREVYDDHPGGHHQDAYFFASDEWRWEKCKACGGEIWIPSIDQLRRAVYEEDFVNGVM